MTEKPYRATITIDKDRSIYEVSQIIGFCKIRHFRTSVKSEALKIIKIWLGEMSD